jgi:tetratricopeptide (TPR) repeat protein
MTILRNWGLLIGAVVIGGLGLFAFLMFGGEGDDGPVTVLPEAYSQGVAAADRGDWSAAAAAFETALSAQPDAPPLLFALGAAYAESGQKLRAAVYLNAYLEAWPDARNARAVKAQIKALVAPYREAARAMAEEAVVQLDGIVDDAARGARSRALVGQLLDLRPAVFDGFAAFAAKHPSRVTEATLNHILARGTGVSAPEVARAWLADAIEGESRAAGEDVWRAGCADGTAYAAPQACSVLQGAEAQACFNDQAGVGSTTRRVMRGDPDAFASRLNFYAAARLWVQGVDGQAIVAPLVQSYNSRNALARQHAASDLFSPARCSGWPGDDGGISFIPLIDGSGIEGWLSNGKIDLSRPAPGEPKVPAAQPWRTWTAVVAEKTIDVGPDRTTVPFNDPVFGDLSDAVRVIGRETAEARPERLGTLAWRLGLLVQRLDPA